MATNSRTHLLRRDRWQEDRHRGGYPVTGARLHPELNEYERVRKAKLTGKIDVAFVVAARLNGFDKPPEYVCGNFLEAVSLTTCRKVVGRLRDFWPLQFGDIDPDQPL